MSRFRESCGHMSCHKLEFQSQVQYKIEVACYFVEHAPVDSKRVTRTNKH